MIKHKKNRSFPPHRRGRAFPSRGLLIGGAAFALLLSVALALWLGSGPSAPRRDPLDAEGLALLAGKRINGDDRYGSGGLKAGDPADALYAALPAPSVEEQPDAYVLLYAEGLDEDGLPLLPYGVLVPSGDLLRVHLAARHGEEYALADFYINPDSNLIERIEWALAHEDALPKTLMPPE